MFRAVALAIVFVVGASAAAEASSPAGLPVPPDVAANEAGPPIWAQPSRHLTIQLPGMSHHFGQPTDRHGNVQSDRKFNEKNWGVGIQLERALSGDWQEWVTKTSFGVMKDSLDAMGLYAGHALQKRVVDGPGFTADVGGGAFLFYRTLRFDGPHLLIPAALPVLSAQHKDTQIGLNLLAIPPCKLNSGTVPGVIYVQFTKAF